MEWTDFSNSRGDQEATMSDNVSIVLTPEAQAAMAARGSLSGYAKKIAAGYPDRVTSDLAGFIAELDTAFLATTSAEGAPYIQHRGGPKGFIKVLDDRTLSILRATTGHFCFCWILPTGSGSRSGAGPASSKTIRS
jgi:hypothetical protein